MNNFQVKLHEHLIIIVIIVAGGQNDIYLNTAELYDPLIETWTATGNMANATSCHTATLLTNGRVLVAGGSYNLTTIWLLLNYF